MYMFCIGVYIQKRHRGKILCVVEYIGTILGHMNQMKINRVFYFYEEFRNPQETFCTNVATVLR